MTSSDHVPDPADGAGLRDRKARQTRSAIHAAAVRLAHEHGTESATIAQIAAEANISQRTFFNYFASKEDAIVGTPVSGPDRAAVREVVAAADFSDDLFDGTARVLRDVMAHSPGDDQTAAKRRELLLADPALMQRKSDAGGALITTTIDALAERLADVFGDLELPDSHSVRDATRMVVLIALAPVRGAQLGNSAAPPEAQPAASQPALSEPSPSDGAPTADQDRLASSLSLFHTVLEARAHVRNH